MRAKLSTMRRIVASCFASRIRIAQARHDQVSCRTIIDGLVAGGTLVHRFVEPTQYNQHSLTRSGPRPSGTFSMLERYHLGARESAFQHTESSSMLLSQMEASPRRDSFSEKPVSEVLLAGTTRSLRDRNILPILSSTTATM